MGKVNLPEPTVRTGVGLVLWVISSVLTAGLFIGFAGESPIKQGVLLGLAVGLEGAKILTWRMGGAYRVLAVSLITLSALASLGAALETVEALRAGEGAVLVSPQADDIAVIDQQINILVGRLENLPADYTSAARQLNADIEQLRSRREAAQATAAKLQQQAQAARETTMFDLIARALGLRTEIVMLAILLFMAANLEVAALLLAGKVHPPISARTCTNSTISNDFKAEGIGHYPIHRHRSQVSPEDFLKAAMAGADLPMLHGRETTARKLGIRSYEAKLHVKALVEAGRITVAGKRLKLSPSGHPDESERFAG